MLANPGILDMIRHHRQLYADLAAPREVLKQRSTATKLSEFWTYTDSNRDVTSEKIEDRSQAYTDLMSHTQSFIADDVLRAYRPHGHKHWLDVAGGDGTFLRTVSRFSPELELSLLDLPPVAKLAQARFTAAGVEATIHSANMFDDPWPIEADIISFIRVLHDHDDEAVIRLLAKARHTLPPGGTLLIAEPMADSPRAGDAYFGLYLWTMGSGRPRSVKELSKLLKAAGFRKIRKHRTRQPLLVRVISAS